MKRLQMLSGVCVVLLGMTGVASATTINYLSAVDGNNYTTPYAGVQVETFDSALLWTWAGDGAVVSGSVEGRYSAPHGVTVKDTTNYVTVPTNLTAPNSYTATDLGGSYNYFGIWWGSVDTYNTLSFFDNGTLVASFTGSSITAPNAANGNQVAPSTNLYVNFLDLPSFNSFMMTSSNFAFEADNIAVGNVPEPSTLLLLGAGLLGLAGVRTRKPKK